MENQIQLFDTTLRDGSQGEHISFSLEDKLRIAHKLDAFGMHYIEGGWPGSNPKDILFFQKAKTERFEHAKLCAFGSTRRASNPVERDANIRALVEADTPAVSIFGKSWLLHVRKALRISPEANLELIRDSVRYLKSKGREVIFDAEHFFDGYRDDPDYALAAALAAEEAGADVLVLCDTNGGTITSQLSDIARIVVERVRTPLGIHAHNDSDLAVANTLAAVEAGCVHVQGTVNGYGERCGNANLCSVIPNLQLKMGISAVPDASIRRLTDLSRFVSDIANLGQPGHFPFVGRSAFAHKGGVHVSAVMRTSEAYEHIDPAIVGNARRVLVSDLSGQSNVLYKANERGVDLEGYKKHVPQIVERLKDLEHEGYQFEAAEGSFDLLVRKMTGQWSDCFDLEGFRVLVERNQSGAPRSEASIRLRVGEKTAHTASEGKGPVHALDLALRKALRQFFPEIDAMRLSDYKVRDLNTSDGTHAKVRVLIESSTDRETWSTVGVSDNILEASWLALMDSFSYFLMKRGIVPKSVQSFESETLKEEVTS